MSVAKSALIFDISRFSIHDGPGIRTTVFFKGCPLNCAWCHNPEGIKTKREILFRSDRCITCNDCVATCKQGAISNENPDFIDRKKCIGCGDCAEACASRALELAGKECTVDELLEILLKDKPFYDESGGGITFSGGEPIIQQDFITELTEACLKEGISVALDTTGYMEDSDSFVKLCNKFDYILYDIKTLDGEKHLKYTSVKNDHILQNHKALAGNHPHVRIRYPLIPGINDSNEDINSLGNFVSGLKGIKNVDILPYHAMAKEKWKRLGRKYRLENITLHADETHEEIINILNKYGLTVNIGG
jgi:pyruvate formate lyase activating enzyme